MLLHLHLITPRPGGGDAYFGRDRAQALAFAVAERREMLDLESRDPDGWKLDHGDLTADEVLARWAEEIAGWHSEDVEIPAHLVVALLAGLDDSGRSYVPARLAAAGIDLEAALGARREVA